MKRGLVLLGSQVVGCLLVVTLLFSQRSGFPGQIVFSANINGKWNLFLWKMGGEPLQLTDSRSDAKSPALSPDSSLLSYTTSDGALWLRDMRSGGSRQLGVRFSNGSYGNPAWLTPDLLIYTLYVVTPPTEDSDIFSHSMADGHQRAVIRQTGSQDFAAPSPDGLQIAYMSSVTTTVVGLGNNISQQLWIAHLRSGKVDQLTVGGERDSKPRWAPNGKSIAFSSDRGGNQEIWVVDVANKNAVKVTSGPGEKTDPCWSLDGNGILYIRTARDKPSLELLHLSTGRADVLRPFGSKDVAIRDPVWGK